MIDPPNGLQTDPHKVVILAIESSMVKPAENQTESLQVMLVKWDIICQIALKNVLEFKCGN